MYKKYERDISYSEFVFTQSLGTRESIVAIQVFGQNCFDHKKVVCLCFLDSEKAFNRVKNHKLLQLLRKFDLEHKDVRCIENLYWIQLAHVELDHITSSPIHIRKCVNQGCVLSPLLFILYSEVIF